MPCACLSSTSSGLTPLRAIASPFLLRYSLLWWESWVAFQQEAKRTMGGSVCLGLYFMGDKEIPRNRHQLGGADATRHNIRSARLLQMGWGSRKIKLFIIGESSAAALFGGCDKTQAQLAVCDQHGGRNFPTPRNASNGRARLRPRYSE